MQAWLRKQPREVSVAFAARAALRVLPILRSAQRRDVKGNFFADIVLTVFRATGVAWAAAKYPAQATEFRAAARGAARAIGFNDEARVATSTVLDAEGHEAFVLFGGDATAAGDAADAARATARAAARAVADSARSAGFAAAAAAAAADTTAFAAAKRAFWSAVSLDATGMEEGFSASVIAESMLWPQDHPDQLQSLWQEMKAALRAAGQDWQVWTIWYDDRLEGHVRSEERELAYVRIDNGLWRQGPAKVNEEIRKRIEELEPPPPIAGAAAQHLPEILAG